MMQNYHSRNCCCKCRLRRGGHFIQVPILWALIFWCRGRNIQWHYNDVIMGAIASQITSLTIVYSTFYSGADQRKHQSSASLVFVCGIQRWPVNSPHKGPAAENVSINFDDVIMELGQYHNCRWPGDARIKVYNNNDDWLFRTNSTPWRYLTVLPV